MNFTDTTGPSATTGSADITGSADASPAPRSAARLRLATVTVALAMAAVVTMSVGACSSTTTGGAATGNPSSAPSIGSSAPIGGSASNGPPAASAPAGGSEATSQLCTDFVTQSVALLQPILPLLSGASTAQLQQSIGQIKTAMTAWAKLMSDDANKASDPAFATALRDTAKQIDQAAPQITASSTASSPAMLSLMAAGGNLVTSCPNIAQLGQ